MLDLARELQNFGYDVKFYSYVPNFRLKKFGFKGSTSSFLFFMMIPFLALEKFLPSRKTLELKVKILDFFTSIVQRKADLTIAMSGLFVKSLIVAQKKGSKIIVERGSKHILAQKKILEGVPSLSGTKPVPDFDVDRELKSYQLADYVAVASEHVKNSFKDYKFDEEKIFVNPYGVDLKDFYAQERAEKKYDVIFVGNWSYQKGCDLLTEACEDSQISVLHVGAIQDLQFPEKTNFTHIDSVDQKQLVNYYNQARIFCLPSRQEGLALVMAQAVSCGLPIVASNQTGAEDIKRLIDDEKSIYVFCEENPQALKKNILLALSETQTQYDNLNDLSWKAYGERYSNFIKTLL